MRLWHMAAARWQTRKTWCFTLVTSGYHLSFMKHCIFVAPPPIGYISRRRSPRSQCWICCAMSTSLSMLIALEIVGSTPHPPTPFTTETPSLSNQLVLLRKKRRRFLWAYNLFVCIENDINENIIFSNFLERGSHLQKVLKRQGLQ